jgi:HD-GYP domain-containing protein (c-di-GMP phosphodiesterase class II)
MSTKPIAASAPPVTSAADQFVPPAEWRVRCNFRRLNSQTKLEYVALKNELIRCLIEAPRPDFVLFLLVDWDLYEFVRPADYTVALVQEMFEVRKKWPNQTRILILEKAYPRYERLASDFRKRRFEAVSGGETMAFMPVYDCYSALSDTSQKVFCGGLNMDLFSQISAAASYAFAHMQSTKNILDFLIAIVAKDPIIYDHSAVTALVALTIAWNVFGLTKRESKLCCQAALMHDVERNCAHLYKVAVPYRISLAAIKEVKKLHESTGAGFHPVVVSTMGQYREKFAGGGFPGTSLGSADDGAIGGIERAARITAIACAFSECLLKRQGKSPLSLPTILGIIQQRGKTDFDPEIVEAFVNAATSNTIRKASKKSDSGDRDDFED